MSSSQNVLTTSVVEPKENLNPDQTITNEKTGDVTIAATESNRSLIE